MTSAAKDERIEADSAEGGPIPAIRPRDKGPGLLLTLEGGDGCGKTTHSEFLRRLLALAGYEVVHVREPGGTLLGESLRALLLDPANGDLTPEAELLLYEAARAQLVNEVIEPAIEAGKVVVCDRFTDSTIAYQGYGRRLDRDLIERLNSFATGSTEPDITVLLHCGDRSEKRDRVDRRDGKDRLELAGNEFHTDVIRGFLEIAQSDPERILVVDTSEKHSITATAIIDALSGMLPGLDSSSDWVKAELERFDSEHDHSTEDAACPGNDGSINGSGIGSETLPENSSGDQGSPEEGDGRYA